MGGSEYAAKKSGKPLGPTPPIDHDLEARVQSTCLELIQAGIVRSAHDVSDGGLAVALAEMCIAGGKGAWIGIEIESRPETVLFGEGAARIVVEVADADMDRFEKIAGLCPILGRVTDGDLLHIGLMYWVEQQGEHRDVATLSLSVTALKEQWEGALQWAMR